MNKARRSALIIGLLMLVAAPVAAVDPSFVDVTNAAGINVIYSANGFTNSHYASGAAVGDFNRDGWQDLYIPTGGAAGVPDRLYINNQDGTFTDEAALWGLTVVHSAKGFAVGDFDKDGWVDIYVTSAGPHGNDGPCHHKLYRNNNGTSFTDVALAASVNCTTISTQDGWGAAFGDYDIDGDLDLFVAGFASNNSGSRIFRNNGNSTFTDRTAAIAFFGNTPISMSAFTPRFIDMDGDFYPDIPLVADFGTSRYFKNDTDGTFTDVTGSSNTSLEENGMGGAIGDFDGNLQPDWLVTSIYQPSINWTGSKLYLNQGNHDYTEIAAAAGIDDGGYGWGALAIDLNHDTLLDIIDTNGGLGGEFANEQTYLRVNQGNLTFQEQAIASGLVHTGNGRGMVTLDYDNDGDLDVAIFGRLEFVKFFENTLPAGPTTHWSRIFIDSYGVPGLAPGGLGARVYARAGLKNQMQIMSTRDTFLSQSEMSVHFGLGAWEKIDLLRVEWPNGDVTSINDIAADQTFWLMADGPVVCSPAPAEIVDLRLELQNSGKEIHFTWDDAPDADSYRVQADSHNRGGFELVIGDATSGATGLIADTPLGGKFFLVAGRKDGCQGPKH